MDNKQKTNEELSHYARFWASVAKNPENIVFKCQHSDSPCFAVMDREFEFVVRRVPDAPDNDGKTYYTAETPYRAIVYCGSTPELAIGAMLHGVAELARKGSMNPADPSERGDPPIQHAIHLLTERLLWQVEQRHTHLLWLGETPNGGTPKPEDTANIARDNEVISALATSIAALARVKDL